MAKGIFAATKQLDMPQVHNFSAGPSILPQEAIEEAIEGLRDFKGTGIPVVSVSHRSRPWEDTMEEADSLIRELVGIGDDYGILFLQGGASFQFTMVPYNLLPDNATAAYLNTGTWAKNAIKEAKIIGNVNVVASSEAENFNHIPKNYTVPEDSAYFHVTSNNTIFGTQMHEWPDTKVPLVADMSSDIFSRPFDVNKFGLIYAGAQKNMGPAGTTLVIVRKDLLGKSGRKMPAMLDYKLMLDKESMFNTPPVFPIYLSYLTLKWLKKIGGLSAIQKHNEEKAALLYNEIDSNPLFTGTAAKEDRSLMNVTFLLKDSSMDSEFMEDAKKAGISGIAGHRSVGGFRASIYNAMPTESVQVLVDVMRDFAQKKG